MVRFRGKTKNVFLDKLRGDEEETQRWVYGYYCQVEGKHYIIPDSASYMPGGAGGDSVIWGFIEVIPSTIAQFTGLKDKNKKEIYSSIPIDGVMSEGGDILKDDVGDIGAVIFGKLPLGKAGDCVCRYSAFYVKCFGQLGQAPTYECVNIGDWMEIIGNQTDNKNLLK